MARKKKVQPQAAEPVANKKVVIESTGGFALIRFDRKVYVYIISCLVLYFAFTLFKIHNSSIPMWNKVCPDGGDTMRGLIYGKPLLIRADEWSVQSSFILAQQKAAFPAANTALGYGKSPLLWPLWNLPTNHFLSWPRPVFWGYYFLDIERGFAWQWNFKIFPFLIASFLLLMLFTGNNFLLSVFGSLWLILSSGIQWWSINTDLFTYGCIVIISFIYIFYASKPWVIVLNGVLLFMSLYSYAMVLYPAYQVPLAYFMLAAIIGFAISNKTQTMAAVKEKIAVKIIVMGCVLICVGGLLLLFYNECKDTIHAMTSTFYPGQRRDTGGDFPFLRIFVDNFSLFMNENFSPEKFENICEVSSFLMFAPLITGMVIYNYLTTKKVNWLLASIVAFQLIMFIWVLIGFPKTLAGLSFMNFSPAKRTFWILGFTNVISTIIFLSDGRMKPGKSKPVNQLNALAVILLVVTGIDLALNRQMNSMFTMGQVLLVSIIFSALCWLVIYSHEKKVYANVFIGICLLFVIPNITANPLCQGLDPFLANSFYKTVSDVHGRDPKARWVVYGSPHLSNFLKAAGIDCFSGTQLLPPLQQLHILDPAMQYDTVYNRYAHVSFSPLIDGKDSVNFSLVYADEYMIQMDPCSPRFKKIGVKYVVFGYLPQAAEIRNMEQVLPGYGFLYRFKD